MVIQIVYFRCNLQVLVNLLNTAWQFSQISLSTVAVESSGTWEWQMAILSLLEIWVHCPGGFRKPIIHYSRLTRKRLLVAPMALDKALMYCQESILAIVVFPRQEIIMYNEFGVLLSWENYVNLLQCAGWAWWPFARVMLTVYFPIMWLCVGWEPAPPPVIWALSFLFKPAFEA